MHFNSTMKQSITILFALITLSFFSACNKDQCDIVQCENGALCDYGICTCAEFYEGARCEIDMAEKFSGTFKGKVACLSGDSVPMTLGISESNQVRGKMLFEEGKYYGTIVSGSYVNIPVQSYYDDALGVNVAIQGSVEVRGGYLYWNMTKIGDGYSSICGFKGVKL